MRNKFLYLLFSLILLISIALPILPQPWGGVASATTLDLQISASANDVAVWKHSGVWEIDGLAGTAIPAGNNTGVYCQQGGGFRWLNVTVPPGVTITSAYISLKAAASEANTVVRSYITGDNPTSGNATIFSTLADYQARRGTAVGGATNNYRTTAQVAWDSIAAWTLDTWYNSVDISPVIQEIIGDPGWASGNALALYWDDYDMRGTQSAVVRRTGYSWDNPTPAGLAPKLHIEYTTSAPTVVTLAASAISSSTATLSGNITATGGADATTRGFQYGKISGALDLDTHEHGTYGVGNYSLNIASLDSGTTYYFMAYAINTVGTGYGAEGNFTTSSIPPVIASWEVAGWGDTWVILKGKLVSGSPLTSEGFNYGLTTSYGGNSSGTLAITVGNYFVQTIYNLTPNTLYHWRAWGTNGAGTGIGADSYFSTGSPVLYEYSNLLGNTTSGDIYGAANYYAESFMTGNASHSVVAIKLLLQRVSVNPGTITVSLRNGDTNYLPTGADINDLDTAIYNGNLLSTTDWAWTIFQFDSPYPQLEPLTAYTIVARATSGNSTDHIHWRANNGIGAIPMIGSHSTDGGAVFVSDAPMRYLFEIWGDSFIKIPNGAIAVQTYNETGDMVFGAELINTYAPYYPDSTEYGSLFSFQLLDTDGTTILASVLTQGWDDTPNFIYLSANTASALAAGDNLYVRLYANFGNHTSFSYQLLDSDWKGSLDDLGKWCVQTGTNMESYWTSLGYTSSIIQVATSSKNVKVLTNAGGAMFERALPQLSSKLPNYFASTYSLENPPDMDFNPGLADTHKMADMMGATFVTDMTTMGTVFGISATETGQIGWFALALIIGIITVAVSRSTVFGLFLGTGTLVAGTYLGLVNPAFVAAAVFTALFLWGMREFVFK